MSQPTTDEQRYLRMVEDAFIRLRGAPFLLSPSDWRLASGWFRQGIPAEVVLQALEEVFARRVERGEGRKVQSLRYCAAAVEEAWRERRELGELAPGGAGDSAGELPAIDVRGRLDRLASRLPDALADREEWAARVRAAGSDARAAERALTALDTELVDGALDALDRVSRREIEAEVEASLAAIGSRVAAEVLAVDRDRLIREAVRRRAGLPLLSLFSPDAVADES